MCNLEFTFGKYHLPEFKLPEGYDSFSYLKKLCDEGYKARYGDDDKYRGQLKYEQDMIEKMGFTDYFLIVSDFVRYAKSVGIPVGPGRGSAAGSMVSYCLSITDIDPMKYSLYFERFLNPERVSMPDIDMDFGDTRRGEVVDYVRRKYGDDHVAQIVTFGTMAARGVIRDVGRVLGMVGLTVLRPMEAAFYLFIGTLLQGAFRSLQKQCTKPAMVVACGIGGTVLTVGCGLLAQAAPQDMYDLTASRPLLSLAAAALGCAGILGISLALGKVPMLNKGLAYLGVHALYLMAIHNQPNLYGWLNKLSVKLCAGLPGWYMQGMFFLLLTVAALIIAMGLEPRLDPAVRALARRCTGQRKDQTNPERS